MSSEIGAGGIQITCYGGGKQAFTATVCGMDNQLLVYIMPFHIQLSINRATKNSHLQDMVANRILLYSIICSQATGIWCLI